MQWQFYPSWNFGFHREMTPMWEFDRSAPEDAFIWDNYLFLGCFQFRWYSNGNLKK